MKNKYIQWMKTSMIGATLLLSCYACSDAWDDHYDQNSEAAANSSKTLWESIKGNESLQDFAAICEKGGYDKILNASLSYTVWAPEDGSYDAESVMQMDSATIVLEFIKNHVARYNHVATGEVDDNIYMLNTKMNAFTGSAGSYSFKDSQLTEQMNVPAKNGILHVIRGKVDYFPNIWEYLARDTELSDIKDFMYAYNRETLDRENSVEGPTVDGEITYLDSVMINTNTMMQYVGWLDREDSIYTMIVPTNRAWESAYEKISKYYNYYSRDTEFMDSIKAINVGRAIIKSLVFNNKQQQNREDITLSPDSLFSTRQLSFYAPYHTDLFVGATKHTVSNGYVYTTDSLRYLPWMSYQLPINVEAESSSNFTVNVGSFSTYRVNSNNIVDSIAEKGRISNGYYLEVVPPSATQSPSVTFKLRNTLSARYNIKAVFVPANIISSSMDPNDLKPQQLYFQMTYPNGKGSTGRKILSSLDYPQEKGFQIDTLTIFEDFEFPECEYDLGESSQTEILVRLTTKGNKVGYDRTIRLDCILLEPVEEDE